MIEAGPFTWIVDYHPTRRTRRWSLVTVGLDRDEREYRCFTQGGAERLGLRLRRRTLRAMEKMS